MPDEDKPPENPPAPPASPSPPEPQQWPDPSDYETREPKPGDFKTK